MLKRDIFLERDGQQTAHKQHTQRAVRRTPKHHSAQTGTDGRRAVAQHSSFCSPQSHLVTIALLPDSASPKNMNLTIFPRPFAVGLFSANFCALEFILCGRAAPERAGAQSNLAVGRQSKEGVRDTFFGGGVTGRQGRADMEPDAAV